MNQKSKSLALSAFILLNLGLFFSHQAHCTPVLKDATGICFRRLVWTDRNGELRNYFEFVLVSQSSDTGKDVRRVKKLQSSPAKSPDLTPFVWHSAWVTDSQIDAVNGPDCSALPIVQRKDAR